MKIAHVVDSMEVGGVETLVAQMCAAQRAMGHEVSVLVIGALGPLGLRMLKAGFDVRQAHAGRLPAAVFRFYRILRQLKPAAVHLHNPTPTSYASLAAKAAGVQCVVSTRHNLVAKPRRHLTELKYACSAMFCDWIVGVCDAAVMNLKQAHPREQRKMTRIYNGILPVAPVPRDHWPAKGGFTLLYVGRLAPVKNLGMLLEAFQEAFQAAQSLRLWVVGDGSDRSRLEQHARDLDIAAHVTFWGEQLDPAPFFSAADAFAMSSTSEGLPISLLQAFSAGLPAVVTDIGGMGEAVRIADAGAAIPASDRSSMAKAILRLAGDDRYRKLCAENAKAAFEARFTLQAVVSAYERLYSTPWKLRGSQSQAVAE